MSPRTLLFLLLPLGTLGRAAEPLSVEARLAQRSFPSIFQAWSPCTNRPELTPEQRLALHDLAFVSPKALRLQWDTGTPRKPVGLAQGFTPESVVAARAYVSELHRLNPRLILLIELRYRDAHRSHLGDDSPYWWRGPEGAPVSGWAEGGFWRIDFRQPEYQVLVAAQAAAVVGTGCVDGVMLDWWEEREPNGFGDARLALARRVRASLGDKALLIVNSNHDKRPVRTASLINGLFMESYRSRLPADWEKMRDLLTWAEANLRAPRINCLETWFHKSRQDLALMRATTTLALVCSDGFALFGDPNPLPTPDHQHDWYDFWAPRLGRPTAAGAKRADGVYSRDYTHGRAFYNPMGNGARTVALPSPGWSLARQAETSVLTLGDGDGDIVLQKK